MLQPNPPLRLYALIRVLKDIAHGDLAPRLSEPWKVRVALEEAVGEVLGELLGPMPPATDLVPSAFDWRWEQLRDRATPSR